jgi:hypothetical protein
MARLPNEQDSPEQDTSQETQVGRERADFGPGPCIAGNDVSGIGELSLVDRQEPESIFASQFAEMAAIMEGILAKKKSKQTSQSSTHDAAPPVGRQNGVSPKTRLASVGRDSSITSPSMNTAGEEPAPTTDPAVNPDQHMGRTSKMPPTQNMGVPAQARLLAQGQPPQRSNQSRPSGTAVNGGIQGLGARMEKANPLPTGQSWW